MMRFAALGAVGLLLLSADTAFAQATVTPLGGIVLVNHGSGFVNLAERRVQTGDRLMVRPGGRADLTYANGCVNRLAPGAVVLVGTPASCLAASRVGAAQSAAAAQANGSTAAASTSAASGGVAVGAGGIAGLGVGGTILVGGLVVGGLVAGVMAVSSSSGNSETESPLSP